MYETGKDRGTALPHPPPPPEKNPEVVFQAKKISSANLKFGESRESDFSNLLLQLSEIKIAPQNKYKLITFKIRKILWNGSERK